ncbi:hypothetical protein [Spirosoma radiotolerans]|nr:hypothetical protein [Spirosoma radiotolerans]
MPSQTSARHTFQNQRTPHKRGARLLALAKLFYPGKPERNRIASN